MNKTIRNGIGLAALAATCAAGTGYSRQQQYTSEQEVRQQLEAITASGYFSVMDEYRNEQIDQHSTQYMNELQNGARVALKHAPNAVFELAVDQYAEDVNEYLETRIYVMQQMQDKGGFSFNYDLNQDE
ncbi:hypothetical protein HZA99_03550 [Candidatus Woesearchaeota archaeon]|nr:hypothetical protein [Candidatus Woesearchaeota archaeon]